MSYEIQRSFAAGELSPKLLLRSDSEGLYQQAVQKMLNMEAEAHGPARSRAGFEYVLEIPNEEHCRLFDFEISLTETYVIAISTTNIYILDKTGVLVTIPDSPYNDIDLLILQTEKVPGNKRMYLVTRGVAPRQLTYNGPLDWTFDNIAFDFGVAQDPPWGDGTYPGTLAFHDGRFCLGGSEEFPVTVWMSRPNDYGAFDFDPAGDSEPDDPMELPLDKHGNIHWLQANDVLFVGLDTGEHTIFGNTGAITPANAQTEQQSTYGSVNIHALTIDEKIMFMDTQARILRGMQYVRDQQSYGSENITFQAEHITDGSVRELWHGQSPSGRIYLPMANGNVAVASIEEDQGTLGWYLYDTEGEIKSVAIVKEIGYDVLWIAVYRDGKLFIERTDIEYEIFMDSYKTVTVGTETNVFTGFDHLIGQTVQVVADGAVHPEVVVAGDGSITLQDPIVATVVTAGYGFLAEMITLPEMKDQEGGNTLNHTKRYSEIYLYLNDSPKPDINGQNLYNRNPITPMDTVEPPVTGIVSFSNDIGWDVETSITISQPLPVDLNILAVGGRLKENKI